MWILESRGDDLKGKRLWLKPGKKYLFGRLKKDGVQFLIDDHTVSRKQLIIDVSSVPDNEVTQIHTRTKITIIDQNSKFGTTVNGHLLRGKDFPTKELTRSENSIRPGQSAELVIRWQPCILTFYLLKKDLKAGALKSRQDRTKSLGIKAISDFVPDYTTHVVAVKRNTPKGLQALITGRYLVSDAYLDAIEYVAAPNNIDEEEGLSPLELDFDTNWPDPKDYLPLPGKEPTARPANSYQPGPDRSQIFSKFTFIFCDEHQYESLLPVITTGHGKALFLKIVVGETTIDDVLQYMQTASGSKNFEGISNGNRQGGVVLVKVNASTEQAEQATKLINEAALKVDQRPIDQSEFLDAILANDAYLLKQPVPYESQTAGLAAPPSTPQQSFAIKKQQTQMEQQSSDLANGRNAKQLQPQSESVARTTNGASSDGTKSNTNTRAQPTASAKEKAQSQLASKEGYQRRAMIQVKFDDGFDDGFDASAPTIDEDEEEDKEPEVADDSVQARASVAEGSPGAETQNTRKRLRSASPVRTESNNNDLDDLVPAANALKRQKLAAEAEAKRTGRPLPSSIADSRSERPKKTAKKEINVREMARAQREKEEAEQEEVLPPHDANDRAPANLVQIEEMDIPIRNNKPLVRTNPEDDPRWDPRWNGRKNFKKFRPQQAGAIRRTGHASKVIVSVVPVKTRPDGLGDQYWDKGQEEKQKKRSEKAKSQRSQTQIQRTRQTGGSTNRVEPETDVDDNGSPRHTSPAAALLREAASIVDHEIDPDSPRTTRSGATESQTRTQGTKRPASRSTGAMAKKKQKVLPVTTIHGSDSDEDEDSDDMKFKFGSRRRAKAKA